MTTKQKKAAIKKLAKEMLKESHAAMVKKLDTVLLSGAIDIDAWDTENAPMVTPKTIVMALFESEATQYSARGTSYEKQIKKEVKNIRYFI